MHSVRSNLRRQVEWTDEQRDNIEFNGKYSHIGYINWFTRNTPSFQSTLNPGSLILTLSVLVSATVTLAGQSVYSLNEWSPV